MSQLRSVLDEMRNVPGGEMTTGELAADIEEIIHASDLLQVLLSERCRSLADRGGHRELGYTSPTALLIHVGRVSPGRAKRIVSRGLARDKAPSTHHAWADGRISTDQAEALFRVAETVPDCFSVAEMDLVEIVTGLDVVDTRRALEYWRQAVDGPGEVDIETQQQRRALHVSGTIGGMRRVDGWLTCAAGEAFETAIDALIPPRRGDDHRSPAQRRHDALEDLCRDWLDHQNTPQAGGEKPHITILTDLKALEGIAGGIHETVGGEIWDVDNLRMIACDCAVSRIVLGPDSEVLDIGRKTRVWTTAQRRAIVARDRHCQAPGCRAKPRHCDIHHVEHWANGGATSVGNGKLLCRPHHTRAHIQDRLRRRERGRS